MISHFLRIARGTQPWNLQVTGKASGNQTWDAGTSHTKATKWTSHGISAAVDCPIADASSENSQWWHLVGFDSQKEFAFSSRRRGQTKSMYQFHHTVFSTPMVISWAFSCIGKNDFMLVKLSYHILRSYIPVFVPVYSHLFHLIPTTRSHYHVIPMSTCQ